MCGWMRQPVRTSATDLRSRSATLATMMSCWVARWMRAAGRGAGWRSGIAGEDLRLLREQASAPLHERLSRHSSAHAGRVW
jgi:hypothetical protein